MTLILVPQLDGGWLQGLNCGAATGALLVAFATGGAKRPTGSQFRSHMLDPNGQPDVSGGTFPAQMAQTASRVYGVHLDVEYGAGFDAAWSLSNRVDRAVGFSISYAPVSGTQYDGSPGFKGNHEIARSGGLVYDPLADGRYSGIPKGPDDWSMALLKNASGRLNVVSGGDLERGITYRALGWGLAYTVTAVAPSVHATSYSVHFAPGACWSYAVANGVITGRLVRTFSHPTSAPCEPPNPVPWPGHNTTKRLVRVVRGALAGRYVDVAEGHITLGRT